jgi:hypothetical protein
MSIAPIKAELSQAVRIGIDLFVQFCPGQLALAPDQADPIYSYIFVMRVSTNYVSNVATSLHGISLAI